MDANNLTAAAPVAPQFPVQIYANRAGSQILMFSTDASGQGKPMLSSDLDDMVAALRALNALQTKMAKFVKALAAANDVDEATLASRLDG